MVGNNNDEIKAVEESDSSGNVIADVLEWSNDILHKFQDASDYVNALHDLPPTFEIAETCRLPLMPDPVTAAEIRNALDKVDAAEKVLANGGTKEGNAFLRLLRFPYK